MEVFLHYRGYTFFTMPGLTYQEIGRLLDAHKRVLTEGDKERNFAWLR